MTINKELEHFIQECGYDPSKEYIAPSSPEMASAQSLKSFMSKLTNEPEVRSNGTIHITGPAVTKNSAPVRTVGNLLSHFQDAVDAVGASIQGVFNTTGALPSSVTARTELSMVASPLPGSVIIQVSPTMNRFDDLAPQGTALFDVEEYGIRPLADIALSELMSLLNDFQTESIKNDIFIEKLTDYGPRTATSIKSLCESASKGNVCIDISWSEPGTSLQTISINHAEASAIVKAIEDASIERETITIEGALITNTLSQKDRLRIREKEGKETTFAMGAISPEKCIELSNGEMVRATLEKRINQKPGGRKNLKFIGIDIAKLPRLTE